MVIRKKGKYILCSDCRKRVYYDEDKGVERFWCGDCYEKKLEKPLFACKMSKGEFNNMVGVINRADSCDEFCDLWWDYGGGELRVLNSLASRKL